MRFSWRPFLFPTTISLTSHTHFQMREMTLGGCLANANQALTKTVESRIFLVRGTKVILDQDLAAMYGVSSKRLNEQVKRNRNRFPPDFMIRLTPQEARSLRSQIATSNARRGGRRTLPYAFTEQGVAMLSSVLRSPRAVRVNIEIMRAFVRLRQIIAANEELGRKLAALEKRYDTQFKVVFDAIRRLMAPPESPRKRIGFHR